MLTNITLCSDLSVAGSKLCLLRKRFVTGVSPRSSNLLEDGQLPVTEGQQILSVPGVLVDPPTGKRDQQ